MSALAVFDKVSNKINIKAKLHFYGKYADGALAQKIVEEINRLWNEPQTFLELGGEKFLIRFEVSSEVLDNSEVLKQIPANLSFENNYIRIEDKNIAERSMMGFGLGENCGHWLISDQLGDSTTAAHEFGHALGLPHPENIDFRFTGPPPIMAPRGTIVDAEYQWNPLAEPGLVGGTMKPIHRKVRSSEVLDIFSSYQYLSFEPMNIGNLSNIIYDEMGRPAFLTYQ